MAKVFWIIALFLLIPTTIFGQEETTHTVAPGDTMWSISQQHDVTIEDILKVNPDIVDAEVIYVKQVIQLPYQESAEESPTYNDSPEEGQGGFVKEVIRLTNEERDHHGLNLLEEYDKLSKVAHLKSEDMRNEGYFSHNSPTYGSPFDMMISQGINFQGAGENLAAGQTSPEQVVEEWMASPGHQDNILRSDFTHIGVGYVEGGANGSYWTQMFVAQ
ncbi:CAP domain-containing protein [Bacillus sp. FJAT-44742]|uniref:CAP domain-containing protein n=1 Tax=Bacillus sp. FJAT-44742 TaxID=2014005 RepID=UPI001E3C0C42|nr:CAP domain-containing protein [Bacillus sp. FJAT-44742]